MDTFDDDWSSAEQQAQDEQEAWDVEIDKCLRCGRYRATESLDADQCCIKGCRNPNEY